MTIATITIWLGAGIWHESMLTLVRMQTMLLQELCGTNVALVDSLWL